MVSQKSSNSPSVMRVDLSNAAPEWWIGGECGFTIVARQRRRGRTDGALGERCLLTVGVTNPLE